MEPSIQSIHRQAATWLITGCSTGIGRCLVTAALARGDKVIATARKLQDLDYVKDDRSAFAVQLDVCEPEWTLRQKIESAIKTMGPIDILVNNAGYALSGVWEELR